MSRTNKNQISGILKLTDSQKYLLGNSEKSLTELDIQELDHALSNLSDVGVEIEDVTKWLKEGGWEKK